MSGVKQNEGPDAISYVEAFNPPSEWRRVAAVYPIGTASTTCQGSPLNGQGDNGGESRERVDVTGGRDRYRGNMRSPEPRCHRPTADKNLCTARRKHLAESGGHVLSVGTPQTSDATETRNPTPLSGKDHL